MCRAVSGSRPVCRNAPVTRRAVLVCRPCERVRFAVRRHATATAPDGPGARSPAETGSHRRRNDELISMQELDMTDVVIVSAARTAVGKFGGSLAKIAA
ncbi:hypothetical protein D7209_31200, partial [Burkholderia cepacia]|nr:hypothetical protein [Burkholderia cepacia]MBB0081101.1 hypothetical protein [Burkholderia cepacia]MBB0124211.1 hypothetical protein [Burkholderia cepacia]